MKYFLFPPLDRLLQYVESESIFVLGRRLLDKVFILDLVKTVMKLFDFRRHIFYVPVFLTLDIDLGGPAICIPGTYRASTGFDLQ